MTKNKTDLNKIEAKFEGGDSDGKTFWLSKAEAAEVIAKCPLTMPVNDECLYGAKEIYKLESKGTPLKYKLFEILIPKSE
jgi:hypothetical protein